MFTQLPHGGTAIAVGRSLAGSCAVVADHQVVRGLLYELVAFMERAVGTAT
jgi:hypothetical protein